MARLVRLGKRTGESTRTPLPGTAVGGAGLDGDGLWLTDVGRVDVIDPVTGQVLRSIVRSRTAP